MTSQQTLYSDDHLTILFDAANRLVRYVRSTKPFATVEEVRRVHAKLAALKILQTRADLKLLLDVRGAPPRNDDEFEAQISQSLGALMPHFSRHAVLVKTAVGRLQITRLNRTNDLTSLPVFDSEQAALKHLRG